MPFGSQQLLNRLAARIGGFVARITDRNDEAADTPFAFFFMFRNRHEKWLIKTTVNSAMGQTRLWMVAARACGA
jgi:hypothetical protein